MSAAACVWITGGGSGVGAALARKLAEAGEQVVISGRQADDLSEVAAGQPGILAFPIDIADSSAVRNGVQRIERDVAPISLAVLTSAESSPVPLSAFERERLRSQTDAGVGGALNCLGALVPVLCQRGRGHVAILPPSGKNEGGPLANLVLSLSHDLAGSGVKIQVIDPELVEGPTAEQTGRAVDAILRGLRSGKTTATVEEGGGNGSLWSFLKALWSRQ
ncbi:MAG TPA: SDR family NAD(P)-dependent oxidoreductase [Magnetospirillaceae bacterium]|nr:SDR family NAD(P)-dependent oxidoreductase [Magnetospirillaceae bacterium]